MKLFQKLFSCLSTPTAAQNAVIELANAERDLLESQTGRDFADAMVKYNEARIARLKRYTQDVAKAEVAPFPPIAEKPTHGIFHVMYQTGDADAPEVIKDSNGEVILNLCKVCGQAESELGESCPGKRVRNGS